MRTAFDPEVRVLACGQCGAPLEGAVGALDLTCAYCDAQNRIAPPAEIAPVAALSHEEQMRRLQAQAGRPRPLSPTVADYVEGLELAPWREQEALVAWVEARRRIGDGDADSATATRFFELTRLLADSARRADDGLRERALLESGYEASPLSRRRTYFAALLAQRAALARDLESAAAWIWRGDAGVDDLEAFSALTIARALVAHIERQSEDALEILDVPLAVGDEAMGAVLAADAHERLGAAEPAVAALLRVATARWPRSRAELALARESLGGEACPAAMKELDERRGREVDASRRRTARVIGAFAALWGVFGLAGVAGSVLDSVAWLVMTVLCALPALLFVTICRNERRAIGGWRRPEWGTVLAVTPPAGKSNGAAEVKLDRDPARPVKVPVAQGEVVDAGMRALLCRGPTGMRWLA